MAAIAATAIAIASLAAQQVMSTLQTRTCSDDAHEILSPGMGGGAVGDDARGMMPPSSTARTNIIPSYKFRRTPSSCGLRVIFLTHPATITICSHITDHRIHQHLKSTPPPSMIFWHIHGMSRVCRHVTLLLFRGVNAISQAAQRRPAASHMKASQRRPDQTRSRSHNHPAKLAPCPGKTRARPNQQEVESRPTPTPRLPSTCAPTPSVADRPTHRLSYHPLTNRMVPWG